MATVIDYDIYGNPVEGKGLRIEIDYAGGPGDQPTFIGWAEPGTATSKARWKIVKLEYSGANLLRKLWPGVGTEFGANTKFIHIWDNRAALVYG